MPESKPLRITLDTMEFGNKLRTLIRKSGYTQEAFAEKVGISYSMLLQIISGRRTPSLQTYTRILIVLGCKDDGIVLFCCHFSEVSDDIENC